MSPINSRAKGKRAELALTKILIPYWPEAKRNLDQFKGDTRDVIDVAGCHFQIKRVEALRLWDAIHQARDEAAQHDIPIVAFRKNNEQWHCIIEADELIALLRLKELA